MAVAAVRYIPAVRGYLAAAGLIAAVPGDDASGVPAATAQGGNRGGWREAPLVVLGIAGEATINDRVAALGTGAAVQSATLLPSDSGLLTELRVTSGAEVAAGDVVAQLDPESAVVAYDAAKIAYDDAMKTLERFQQLGTGTSVSATQLQGYQFAADKAELALRQARIDLDNRRIVSPIAGTVGIIHVNPGVEVTQSTVIATIEDNSAIKVVFALPERYVGKVFPGDAVSAAPVALPGTEVRATVTAVDNRVDEATGSFGVEARIPNTGHDLRSGMSFTMTMGFAGDRYIAVPPLSVQWSSAGAYVWRVTDMKVHRVPVSIVQRNAESVLVAGELAAGDPVVTEGLDGLKDGAAVRVADEQTSVTSAAPPTSARASAPQPAGAAAADPAPVAPRAAAPGN